MAREELSVTQITRDGVWDAGEAGIAAGHKFDNSGRCFAEVANADASPRAVTFQAPKTVAGLPLGELTVTIPAASARLIGPFPSDVFSQPSGVDEGMVYVDYEADEEAHFTIKIYEL